MECLPSWQWESGFGLLFRLRDSSLKIIRQNRRKAYILKKKVDFSIKLTCQDLHPYMANLLLIAAKF